MILWNFELKFVFPSQSLKSCEDNSNSKIQFSSCINCKGIQLIWCGQIMNGIVNISIGQISRQLHLKSEKIKYHILLLLFECTSKWVQKNVHERLQVVDWLNDKCRWLQKKYFLLNTNSFHKMISHSNKTMKNQSEVNIRVLLTANDWKKEDNRNFGAPSRSQSNHRMSHLHFRASFFKFSAMSLFS